MTEIPNYESFLERIKKAFVLTLRTTFANDAALLNYKYSEVLKDTLIRIYPGFPGKLEFYPNIIVEAETADASINYLQDELNEALNEYDPDINKNIEVEATFSGKINLNAAVKINCETPKDRDFIIDRLILGFKHPLKDAIRLFDIEYNKIRIAGNKQELIQGRNVFSNVINFIDCYLEYQVRYDLRFLDILRKIDIHEQIVTEL